MPDIDFGFWILDFGVQFDKLTVRAVTEPVEVQSNDFGFWISMSQAID
jgi:hypothetical protein